MGGTKKILALVLALACIIFFSWTPVKAVELPFKDEILELIHTKGNNLGAGEKIKIALIDSGIQKNNLYIDEERILEGKNYVFTDGGSDDLIGHGTAIAGIILGKKFKTGDATLFMKNVELIPLVCFSRYPSGVTLSSGIEGITEAIYDAVDVFDCRIINISAGIDSKDRQLMEAVKYAEKNGVIVISAVGNSHQNMPERVFYPAAFETVVGVGSVNNLGEVSAFSQRNSSVMVKARGENMEVLSLDINDPFTTVNGTSYAAARVTAFAALLLSARPETTPAEFRELLTIKPAESPRLQVPWDECVNAKQALDRNVGN